MIETIVAAERKGNAEKFLQEIQKIAEAKNTDFNSMLDNILAEIQRGREEGDSFNPLEDDPAELARLRQLGSNSVGIHGFPRRKRLKGGALFAKFTRTSPVVPTYPV